jgi:hypothetical protein
MCYKILKPNGHWIGHSSCTPLSDSDKRDAAVKNLMTAFTTKIDDIIGKFDPSFILEEETAEFETLPSLDENQDVSDLPLLDIDDEETLDPLINAEIILHQGDGIALASVMERKRAHDGSSIGRRNKNPLLDSRIYIVKFPIGEMKVVGYNILAEHPFSQMDKDGNQFILFRGIICHLRNGNAVDKEDQMRISGERKVKKKTLSGWALEVEWRDGGTVWIELKTMKESNAVEVVEYALANTISHEPAFDWWVHDVIPCNKRLLKLSQTRFPRPQYKYGICVPRNIKEDIKFDLENGNKCWEEAIAKEMKNVHVAFKLLEPSEKPVPGYKKLPLRMIFYIKMDFTLKARLVSGGTLTDPPSCLITGQLCQEKASASLLS